MENNQEVLSKSAQTQFAIELYQKLIADDAKNIFVSPHSIAVMLAMVLLGSKQKTAEELKRVLHVDDISVEDLHKTNLETLKQFSFIDKSVVLNSVSNLFPETHFSLESKFVDECLLYYNASIKSLNFRTQFEDSRKVINEWVEKETKDKIKDLLPDGSVSSDTSLILANAVYFKGFWLEKFKESETTEMDFHEMSGKVSKTKMMVQECKLNFCVDNELGIQVVEMPYEGEALSMVLLVPKDRFGLKELQQTLSPEKLSSLLNQLARGKVIVGVPKMKLEYKVDLVPALKILGISNIFDGTKANLQGISSTPNLYVSGIFHKACLEVNEEGTEAAAATGIAIAPMCALSPPPMILCDHPFMFFIKHNPTQHVLFMGQFLSC